MQDERMDASGSPSRDPDRPPEPPPPPLPPRPAYGSQTRFSPAHVEPPHGWDYNMKYRYGNSYWDEPRPNNVFGGGPPPPQSSSSSSGLGLSSTASSSHPPRPYDSYNQHQHQQQQHRPQHHHQQQQQHHSSSSFGTGFHPPPPLGPPPPPQAPQSSHQQQHPSFNPRAYPPPRPQQHLPYSQDQHQPPHPPRQEHPSSSSWSSTHQQQPPYPPPAFDPSHNGYDPYLRSPYQQQPFSYNPTFQQFPSYQQHPYQQHHSQPYGPHYHLPYHQQQFPPSPTASSAPSSSRLRDQSLPPQTPTNSTRQLDQAYTPSTSGSLPSFSPPTFPSEAYNPPPQSSASSRPKQPVGRDIVRSKILAAAASSSSRAVGAGAGAGAGEAPVTSGKGKGKGNGASAAKKTRDLAAEVTAVANAEELEDEEDETFGLWEIPDLSHNSQLQLDGNERLWRGFCKAKSRPPNLERGDPAPELPTVRQYLFYAATGGRTYLGHINGSTPGWSESTALTFSRYFTMMIYRKTGSRYNASERKQITDSVRAFNLSRHLRAKAQCNASDLRALVEASEGRFGATDSCFGGTAGRLAFVALITLLFARGNRPGAWIESTNGCGFFAKCEDLEWYLVGVEPDGYPLFNVIVTLKNNKGSKGKQKDIQRYKISSYKKESRDLDPIPHLFALLVLRGALLPLTDEQKTRITDPKVESIQLPITPDHLKNPVFARTDGRPLNVTLLDQYLAALASDLKWDPTLNHSSYMFRLGFSREFIDRVTQGIYTEAMSHTKQSNLGRERYNHLYSPFDTGATTGKASTHLPQNTAVTDARGSVSWGAGTSSVSSSSASSSKAIKSQVDAANEVKKAVAAHSKLLKRLDAKATDLSSTDEKELEEAESKVYLAFSDALLDASVSSDSNLSVFKNDDPASATHPLFSISTPASLLIVVGLDAYLDFLRRSWLSDRLTGWRICHLCERDKWVEEGKDWSEMVSLMLREDCLSRKYALTGSTSHFTNHVEACEDQHTEEFDRCVCCGDLHPSINFEAERDSVCFPKLIERWTSDKDGSKMEIFLSSNFFTSVKRSRSKDQRVKTTHCCALCAVNDDVETDERLTSVANPHKALADHLVSKSCHGDLFETEEESVRCTLGTGPSCSRLMNGVETANHLHHVHHLPLLVDSKNKLLPFESNPNTSHLLATPPLPLPDDHVDNGVRLHVPAATFKKNNPDASQGKGKGKEKAVDDEEENGGQKKKRGRKRKVLDDDEEDGGEKKKEKTKKGKKKKVVDDEEEEEGGEKKVWKRKNVMRIMLSDDEEVEVEEAREGTEESREGMEEEEG